MRVAEMIKGWRNDPKWVEIVERRNHERAQREIARIKMEYEIQMENEAFKRAIRNKSNGLPTWETVDA